MVTRQEAIDAAGQALALGRAAVAQMTPREQAEAAFTPTGPPVDELEDRIRARRGYPPLYRGGAGGNQVADDGGDAGA